jgi:hypothetical protein
MICDLYHTEALYRPWNYVSAVDEWCMYRINFDALDVIDSSVCKTSSGMVASLDRPEVEEFK